MIFMGTGAAELVPAAFCECEYCTRVRQSGDRRNVRGRSGFQIDEKNLIDLGPDTNYTSALFNVSFKKTENIFFTHTHADHISFANLENLRRGTEPGTLDLWFAESAREGLKKCFDFALSVPIWDTERNLKFFQEHVTVHFVKPYETFRAGDMDVTALPASHPGLFGEPGLNYLFERNGKRFLYACDTGLWCEENYELLKGKPLDVVIMECTFGLRPILRTARHLNIEHMEEMIRRMQEGGAITAETAIYANHMNHYCGMLHEEMEAKMKELFGPNASVGYDGREIAPF